MPAGQSVTVIATVVYYIAIPVSRKRRYRVQVAGRGH